MKKTKKPTLWMSIILISLIVLSSSEITSQAACQHVWTKWKTEYIPTYSYKGYKLRECKNCGKRKRKAIPKKKASSKEKPLIKEFQNYIRNAKKYNGQNLKSCFATPPKDSFFTTNEVLSQFMTSLCTKYNSKMLLYDIMKISIKGNTAKVKVTVLSPNLYDAFYYSYEDMITYKFHNPDASESSVQAYFKQRVQYYAKLDKVMDTDTVLTIPYIKTSQGWRIKKGATALYDIANCQYVRAYKDFFAELESMSEWELIDRFY